MAHIDLLTIRDWGDYTLQSEDGFMDSSKYSTPENESDKRRQLQTQHSQIRDFINNTLVAKINDLDDGEGEITTNYALKAESGKTLVFSYNAANNNRITISLYAVDNTLLDTKTIDLALGKMLTGLSYNASTKSIVTTYVQNGVTGSDSISIAAVLTGYATENWVLSKGYETVANVDTVRSRVNALETFRDTTVPNTYEKISDSNVIRSRVEVLETFKNTTVPSTYETKLDANTHKNNSDIHVTAAKKAYWDAKQQPLVAGAYITLETLADGTVRISAANGTIAVDYRNATNKPSINGIELVGNKTFGDLGLPFVIDSDGNICMEE